MGTAVQTFIWQIGSFLRWMWSGSVFVAAIAFIQLVGVPPGKRWLFDHAAGALDWGVAAGVALVVGPALYLFHRAVIWPEFELLQIQLWRARRELDTNMKQAQRNANVQWEARRLDDQRWRGFPSWPARVHGCAGLAEWGASVHAMATAGHGLALAAFYGLCTCFVCCVVLVALACIFYACAGASHSRLLDVQLRVLRKEWPGPEPNGTRQNQTPPVNALEGAISGDGTNPQPNP